MKPLKVRLNNMAQCPNLPTKRIRKCLIGNCYSEEIQELTGLGIECIPLNKNIFLDEEISCHADILAFNNGNGYLFANNGSIGERYIHKIDKEIIFIEKIKSPYPNDVALNIAYIGDSLVCNKNYANAEILTFAAENHLKIIHSNQGYAKCNLCVVSDNAVITEDSGLAYLLKNYQFDILKIEPGFVHLSEQHYGFIGGASAKLSETELYFSGDISEHPDYNRIVDFLNKYGVKPIYNPNRVLRDFGGIIAL